MTVLLNASVHQNDHHLRNRTAPRYETPRQNLWYDSENGCQSTPVTMMRNTLIENLVRS